jgi:hypothetical protein
MSKCVLRINGQLIQQMVAVRHNTLPDLLPYSNCSSAMLFATNLLRLNMFYKTFHEQYTFIDSLFLLHTHQ